MINHLHKFKSQFRDNLFYIVFFAFMFSFMGWIIPEVYFKYFDKTVYYQISSPVKTEKSVYKPCDVVTLVFSRISLIDVSGESVVELILLNKDSFHKINQWNRMISITKGEKIMMVDYPLDCNVKDGMYYFNGIVTFKVNNIQKNYNFISDSFRVERGEENE